ncbi:MAG TPA: galactokinase [Rhodothermales bacterium]|nr:galactokinase [Rhodothermales bacterium]HRR07164.1 galactokinase [Rhodothermales bacterium]
MNIVKEVVSKFVARFGEMPRVFRAPGRVNLIGEHTDYNGGWVLPAAIDKGIYLACAPSENNFGTWVALDLCGAIQMVGTDFQGQKQPEQTWANYLFGVLAQYAKRGFMIPTLNIVFAGNLPIGAGMSSSAALGAAFAFGLNEIFHLGLNTKELALLVQQAENEYVGIKCGIMDMFTSLNGKTGYALKLDCQTLDFQYVPLELGAFRIVLFNTGVKHALVDSAYNERRAQCESGVAFFRKHFDSELPSLTAAPLSWLQASRSRLDPVVYRRCQYVLEEHLRIQAASKALSDNDLQAFGRLMTATHQGLRDLYEVSCPELDFLVDAVWGHPHVLGARMMGGGFGGCTINLIHQDYVDACYQDITSSYARRFNRTPELYEVVTANGAEELAV